MTIESRRTKACIEALRPLWQAGYVTIPREKLDQAADLIDLHFQRLIKASCAVAHSTDYMSESDGRPLTKEFLDSLREIGAIE